MNRFRSVFAALGLMFAALSAHGQECPASIVVSEAMSGSIEHWNAATTTSTRALVGVDIIDGDLHPDEGYNALLKPQEAANGEYYWKFRGPVLSGVVWMLCQYKGSAIRLTRRVESTATECRVKTLASAGNDRETRVVAACSPAKSSHTR